MIFHIDANSFYASCEQVFRPDLQKSPIAVLSNNDGVIIALNQECKNRGFKRGDAFFKVKESLFKQGVSVFSSNYTLYADFSARLNGIYGIYTEEIEVYSIDESFLFFPEWSSNQLEEIAHNIRNTTAQWTGIPVSVGIAPTKTLAKLCNKLAKNTDGVFNWNTCNKELVLKNCKVANIWGIGYSKAKVLNRYGVNTALDLSHMSLYLAKKLLTIQGMKTVQELQEIKAIDITIRQGHKNITASKSFAHLVTDRDEIQTAVAEYTQEAVRRMRKDKKGAQSIVVLLMNSPWACKESPVFQSSVYTFSDITAYLPEILHAANMLLAQMFQAGVGYRKVMISLLGLENYNGPEQDLFDDNKHSKKQEQLMSIVDKITDKYGQNMIFPGTKKLKPEVNKEGEISNRIMQRNYLSPSYTTNISQLPQVL